MHIHIAKPPNVKDIMEEKNEENRNVDLNIFNYAVIPNQM